MKSTHGPRRWVVPGFPLACPGMRIGLLGGSFNPAHSGHAHISALALARLQLHQIWWLVSPQNPLKSVAGMAPLEERVSSARRVVGSRAIRVCAFEARIGTRFTAATLRFLAARYPQTHFVWIMGADNLAGFHLWEDWRGLAATMPIAVFDRPGEGLRAVHGRAAVALDRGRIAEARTPGLVMAAPPAWTLIHGPLSALSSSAIRAGRRV